MFFTEATMSYFYEQHINLNAYLSNVLTCDNKHTHLLDWLGRSSQHPNESVQKSTPLCVIQYLCV